ncbi:transcriptional regulator [Sphaerisporangium krabiense]|uniref:Putative DNA-binding transcriptional regulator YafY n=1 Tax=Sphaerisporangium krabiense TaxID=763782 RepID=A0A7W8Z0X3_9ACTN|nr:YafY family protein [Sphaerisporangium krabiense]MBB5625422.1 putative DNA-binding transcriptional regulator YafY [Sphaerisporangium krabiense]GII64064.1 transcriptional regulator [Sphaerisporangium krabiense]
MRASRLISAVLLLQSRETMTAAELARELEVSPRTIVRDMTALSAAGVPVYADRGRHGGYRLVGGYRTRLTGLSRPEAEALFLSGLTGPIRDMGLADAVTSARLKVLAALPPGLRDASARAGQRFHLDIPGWFAEAEPPPLLAELARAVWEDRTVELGYRRGDREVTRVARPYGLVLKSGVWYLVAHVPGPGGRATAEECRTYRVDRVVRVTPTGERFTRDEAFDLVDFWASGVAEFQASVLTDQITVRLTAAGVRALRHVVEPFAARFALDAAGEPDERGRVVTRLPVEPIEDVAFGVLLRLGPEVEVLDPPGLRVRMGEAARRMAALYGDAADDQR